MQYSAQRPSHVKVLAGQRLHDVCRLWQLPLAAPLAHRQQLSPLPLWPPRRRPAVLAALGQHLQRRLAAILLLLLRLLLVGGVCRRPVLAAAPAHCATALRCCATQRGPAAQRAAHGGSQGAGVVAHGRHLGAGGGAGGAQGPVLVQVSEAGEVRRLHLAGAQLLAHLQERGGEGKGRVGAGR